jgi:hypothetical protein
LQGSTGRDNRAAFPKLLRRAKRIAPTIAHIWVDKGYIGSTVADAATKAGVTVEVVSGPKPGCGFSSSRDAGWSNAPTAGSTIAAAWTVTTKSPSTLTKASSSAKSPYYSGDSTAARCSTPFRQWGSLRVVR